MNSKQTAVLFEGAPGAMRRARAYMLRHIKTPQHRAACQAARLDVTIAFPLAFASAVQGGASIVQEAYLGMGRVARLDGHGYAGQFVPGGSKCWCFCL